MTKNNRTGLVSDVLDPDLYLALQFMNMAMMLHVLQARIINLHFMTFIYT